MNLSLLYSLLQIESESGNQREMADFIRAHCESSGYLVSSDDHGSLYVTKGDAKTYPCIASHMDTVHRITGDGIAVIDINGKLTGMNPVTMEQTGIGGDDKCGIYAALHCLAELPACKAAFFVDEEVGCLGSEMAELDFFANCRFILQADRRGNSDFVSDISGPLASSRFASAVAPLLARHGYKPSPGAMTDVMALRDIGVGISVANMSAGYYNPHQDCEYIVLADLERVCSLMLDICATCTGVYKFQPQRKKWRAHYDKFADKSAPFTNANNPDTLDFIPGNSTGLRVLETWPSKYDWQNDELDTWPHDAWSL
jgi:acetylornithine deacetylase/succinyl-diaminopimelate desuccinylase-like protein